MRSIVFEGNTWNKYQDLRKQDKNLNTNLCKILREMQGEDRSRELGKPERLIHNLSGLWSRRISQKDRLIYTFDKNCIYIFAIGGHYEKI